MPTSAIADYDKLITEGVFVLILDHAKVLSLPKSFSVGISV